VINRLMERLPEGLWKATAQPDVQCERQTRKKTSHFKLASSETDYSLRGLPQSNLVTGGSVHVVRVDLGGGLHQGP
jgi:hypothetical protein